MHYKHTSIYVAAYDYFIENIVIYDKKYRLLLKWVGTGRHDLSHPFTSHLTAEALLMICLIISQVLISSIAQF